MKKSNPTEKRAKKKQIWIERTGRALTMPEDAVAQLLATNRQQSLRLNPLRAKSTATLKQLQALGWKGAQYDWVRDGYTVDEGLAAIRDSKLIEEGAVFIQNAASWLPVLALEAQPGDAVLDVCAAPGGKTSHIAALTNNQAIITANDNSRARLVRLQHNLQRLGAQIETYTLYDATMLARKLENQTFDRILIDAPCSGEGLMNIEQPQDFDTWSVAHIKRLQQLQKRILTQAWQLLKPGGTLVYSTCTLAPEENEAVIHYLLRNNPDASVMPLTWALPNAVPAVTNWNGKTFNTSIGGSLRLIPSELIEAFFVCKLQKD